MDRDALATFAQRFDPTDPAWNDAFDEAGRYLREHGPVYSPAHGGLHVFSSFEDLRTIFSHAETFSNSRGLSIIPENQHVVRRPTDLDPPQQVSYRRLLDPYLSPRRVGGIEDRLRATARSLTSEFAARGECDAATQYSRPLPAAAFVQFLLNLEADQMEEAQRVVNNAVFTTDPAARKAALTELAEWSARVLERRRREPRRDDILDAIIHNPVDGAQLTEDEQVSILVPLATGGLETTASVISSSLLRMAANGALQERLRRTERLPSQVIDEFLRLGAPVIMSRAVLRDTAVAGHQMRAGDRVVLLIPAANRDPHEFASPEEFDENQTNRHLTFSHGPHRCLGSNLARLGIRVALEVFLADLPPFELAAPPLFRTSQSRSVESLRLRFRAA